MGERNAIPGKPSTPGWYPDPWSATGSGERYFDGKQWGTTDRPHARHSTVATDVRRRRRFASLRENRRGVVAVVLLAAVTAGVWFLQNRGSDSTSSPGSTAPLNRPPPSEEEASKPLGTPRPVPAGTGDYQLMVTQPGDAATPAAFDPCRPIHYVINFDGAPSDASALIAEAIAKVEIATGLQFIADGKSSEAPASERKAYQPQRYRDDRWAPVLIAWSSEQEFPDLAGYIGGTGGPIAVATADGRRVFVTGQVVLDRDQLGISSMADRDAAGATILHELGHLVGLAHTADRGQLMFSEGQPNVREFGNGDLRGLALLGTQPCVPEL